MNPVFSASGKESPSPLADIQLLADGELLSLWEQTQLAVFAIEEHGGDVRMARFYEQAIVMEMRRRHAGQPVTQVFGSEMLEPLGETLPDLQRPDAR